MSPSLLVTASWLGDYRTDVAVRSHTVRVDEPREASGTDTGPMPTELFCAALAIQGFKDVHEINALKNWLSAVIYSVAVATFVIANAVSWPHTLVMLATATLGGYWGAAVARRLPAVWLRRFIIGVGGLLTLYYFGKTL